MAPPNAAGEAAQACGNCGWEGETWTEFTTLWATWTCPACGESVIDEIDREG